jgi:hypothetical protein
LRTRGGTGRKKYTGQRSAGDFSPPHRASRWFLLALQLNSPLAAAMTASTSAPACGIAAPAFIGLPEHSRLPDSREI